MKTINDNQVELLVGQAQKVFIEELGGRVEEIEKLFDDPERLFSATDVTQLLRFFHSINGTASTLGLEYLSSIGKEWEGKIKILAENGSPFSKDCLLDSFEAIKNIRKKINNTALKADPPDVLSAKNEYINMPDRGKILLVDDDIAILKLLENAFTMEGFKVYICDDSESAMDTIAITRPDIIFLDIMMPRLDGYEILKKIKSVHEYSDMHVIFLSSKGEVEDKIKGIKSGADDYIVKPFTIGEVLTRAEMIMRRSASYKEKLLKDSLTDAYSRYYFNLRISEELERFKRNGAIFSIAFVDMDHYKYINDRFGHQTGDHVLKELVSYLSKNIRKCDSIYRFGGEEFIILLPDTTEEKAYTVVDRLRQEYSKQPLSIGGTKLKVTFSAGIRQADKIDESAEQLVSDADKAMYHAKKSGRNRVAIYGKELAVQIQKRTLLIVDDENTILRLLRDRLSSVGYNVITAKDGREAVALATKTCPDAILLDIILPDMDGFEVCKMLKENILTHSSKIIMLSKKKQTESIVKGLHLGADDYVTKPFSIEELEARIMKVLNKVV